MMLKTRGRKSDPRHRRLQNISTSPIGTSLVRSLKSSAIFEPEGIQDELGI
jgi:hypothetical protein